MRRVFLLSYKVKANQAKNNEQLVRAVFEDIHRVRPAGIRYSTFVLDDGLTFVNLVATESDAGLRPLGELESYQRIQQGKLDRFEGPPKATELHEIGSFGVFAD